LILDAAAILKKVQEKYLSLKAYSDEGRLETTGQAEIEFSTNFVAPAQFRFEWQADESLASQSLGGESVVWSNGAKCWEELAAGESRETTVADSFSGCAGMTGGAILMILNLLMPGVVQVNKFWRDMKNPSLTGVEIINETSCYHISGDSESTGDIEAWIGCESFLVHRINEKMLITVEQAQLVRSEAIVALKAMGVKEGSPAMAQALAGFPVKEHSFNKTFCYENIEVDGQCPESIFEPPD
jgi:hypothetical protein